MSLDIYLRGEPEEREETCFHCGHTETNQVCPTLFESNITHNLNAMAEKAGFYQHVWRPEEIGITKAKELIQPLTNGIALMRAKPAEFKVLSASNGWGTYEQFLPWLDKLLQACIDYPEATVEASR